MSFTVLIPARLASTRLPDKPLMDLGGLPMIVRVAQRAQQSQASHCVVATDSERVMQACREHGISVLLTRTDHESGSDRLAEAAVQLALNDDAIVVNVQGDEPLIEPDLINQVAALLSVRQDACMSTAAHAIHDVADFVNPNVVKVVTDRRQCAMYFSRAPIAWWRDGYSRGIHSLASPAPLRHIGIYGYRVGFLKAFPQLDKAPMEMTEALEQLRVLWHGHAIAVHVTEHSPGPGIDTPDDLERVRQLLR